MLYPADIFSPNTDSLSEYVKTKTLNEERHVCDIFDVCAKSITNCILTNYDSIIDELKELKHECSSWIPYAVDTEWRFNNKTKKISKPQFTFGEIPIFIVFYYKDFLGIGGMSTNFNKEHQISPLGARIDIHINIRMVDPNDDDAFNELYATIQHEFIHTLKRTPTTKGKFPMSKNSLVGTITPLKIHTDFPQLTTEQIEIAHLILYMWSKEEYESHIEGALKKIEMMSDDVIYDICKSAKTSKEMIAILSIHPSLKNQSIMENIIKIIDSLKNRRLYGLNPTDLKMVLLCVGHYLFSNKQISHRQLRDGEIYSPDNCDENNSNIDFYISVIKEHVVSHLSQYYSNLASTIEFHLKKRNGLELLFRGFNESYVQYWNKTNQINSYRT